VNDVRNLQDAGSVGVPLAELGKGIPGLDRWGWSQSGGPSRFLGALHSRVRVESYRGDWEAHPYCQRPLLLSYELDRDLADNEAAFLEETWADRDEPSRLSLNALVLCFELPPGDQPIQGDRFLRTPAVACRVRPPGPQGTRLRFQSRLKPAGIGELRRS
jgi:hypothetical protein